MKKIRKYIYLLLIFSYVSFTSCEDFALGEKFLQKPPSGDVTIDTIFFDGRVCPESIMVCLFEIALWLFYRL